MKYELPKLPYSFDALEPYIDAETVEIHHTKHHQTYCNKMNEILEKYPRVSDLPLEEILRTIEHLPIDKAGKFILQNNIGGFLSHNLYWESMGPKKVVDQKLTKEIEQTFGSLEAFKTEFTNAALSRFGSGYAWLCRSPEGEFVICSTKNQNMPYRHNHTPILTIDVWEHAYYLKYRNRRDEYIKQWWYVLKVLP